MGNTKGSQGDGVALSEYRFERVVPACGRGGRRQTGSARGEGRGVVGQGAEQEQE
jgi:hypothetical protein